MTYSERKMSEENRNVALGAYETLAESYAALVDTKPHNAYYERPATLSLLPDVEGKRALDAGCGPGVYSEWLVGRGAEVVAIDASEKMVRLAKKRVGERVHVLRADFGEPLDFPDEHFDLVLSPLALDYVRDWEAVFGEFHRVLRPGGVFVFSIEHPCSTFLSHVMRREKGSYFRTELVHTEWYGFDERVNMPSYRRPIGAMLNPLLEAGFVLERILEPRPTERFKEADPEGYEWLSRVPGFLCIRAARP
jgi:SAM-dependent methyltransferase